MAILWYGFLLLVLMPAVIYFSLAFVLRSARLSRAPERRRFVPLVWPEGVAKVEEAAAE